MHTRVLLLLVYTREHASERFAAAALAMDCCMMIIHLQLHDHNPIDDLITLCRLLCGNLCNRKTYNYNDAFCPPHSLSLFYAHAHAWAHMHAMLFHIFFINDHRIHEILNYTSQWAIGAMRWRLIWVGQRLFRRQLD
jgi:hypothetical protein